MIKFYLKLLKHKLLGKLFGKYLDIKSSWEETPKEYSNMVEFLNWFDKSKSINDTLTKSKIDWEFRFSKFNYFIDLEKDSALEIGFGGGRLLTQAAKSFKKVYGVDIHSNFEMSEKFLKLSNIDNATLLHRNEIDGIEDGKINFIYSFIVFQHFHTIEEVKYYLDQIHRLLAKNGTAHIYFGKSTLPKYNVTSKDKFLLRDCSLFINPEYMFEQVSKNFKVVYRENNLPKDPVSNSGKSVQSMIIFKKQ